MFKYSPINIIQVIKNGIIYSLIFSLLIVLDQAVEFFVGQKVFVFSTFPVYTTFLVLVIIWSHKNYIASKKNAFIDILVLSIVFLFFSYCAEYLIKLFFFYFKGNEHTSRGDVTGLLSILDGFDSQHPIFSPINDLIISSFYLLKYYLSELEFLSFFLVTLNSKLFIILLIIYYESLFCLFKKYGKKGWNALIPIQNNLILLSISKKPKWWILLLYIPFVSRVVLFFINKEIANRFDKSTSFALGMTLLPPFFYGEIGLNFINDK